MYKVVKYYFLRQNILYLNLSYPLLNEEKTKHKTACSCHHCSVQLHHNSHNNLSNYPLFSSRAKGIKAHEEALVEHTIFMNSFEKFVKVCRALEYSKELFDPIY